MTESSAAEVKREDLLGYTSEIVAAHVSNNTVAISDLPGLIEQIYKTLASIGGVDGGASAYPLDSRIIRQALIRDIRISPIFVIDDRHDQTASPQLN